MKYRNIAAVLVITLVLVGFLSTAFSKEGLSTVATESDNVSAASGKSISVKSECPAGTRVIGGGGECYGFMNTIGRVALTKSAPATDEAAWVVECTNLNSEPGEIQARAWAVCADPLVLELKEKK